MKHATDPRTTRSPRASKVTTLPRLMGMDDFTRERRMSLHILVVILLIQRSPRWPRRWTRSRDDARGRRMGFGFRGGTSTMRTPVERSSRLARTARDSSR